MLTLENTSLILMSALYILAGISHFRNPSFFLKITPPWVPSPEKVNIIVGIVEVLLGLGIVFSQTRQIAAIGIIVLLIAVFPANIYHFQLAKQKGHSIYPTLVRLPMQLLLIYWAYSFV